MKLDAEDLVGMTPQEAEMLQRDDAEALLAKSGADAESNEEADAEAGQGDDGDLGGNVSTTDDATEPAAEAGGEDQRGPLDADAIKAALGESEATDQSPPPAQKPYAIQDTDFDAKRKELRAAIRGVEQKWSDGELTDEQRIEQLDALESQRDQLLIETTRAMTLREANEQSAAAFRAAVEQQEIAAMRALADAEAKAVAAGKPGVDYAKDQKAQKLFDSFFTTITADPDNSGMPASQRVSEAHRMVQVHRGIAAPAQAQNQAATTQQPQRRVGPTTLAFVPNAGAPGMKDDMLEAAGRLQGEDLEEWMARQSPETVNRLMRLSDAPAR